MLYHNIHEVSQEREWSDLLGPLSYVFPLRIYLLLFFNPHSRIYVLIDFREKGREGRREGGRGRKEEGERETLM